MCLYNVCPLPNDKYYGAVKKISNDIYNYYYKKINFNFYYF